MSDQQTQWYLLDEDARAAKRGLCFQEREPVQIQHPSQEEVNKDLKKEIVSLKKDIVSLKKEVTKMKKRDEFLWLTVIPGATALILTFICMGCQEEDQCGRTETETTCIDYPVPAPEFRR